MINERKDIFLHYCNRKTVPNRRRERNLPDRFKGARKQQKLPAGRVRDADEMWTKFTAVEKRCLSRQAASNWESAVSAT